MTRFVIVVDMQRDFIAADGALPVPGADAIVGDVQRWLGTLDPGEVAGILFTQDTHVADVYASSAEARQFPLHCERGQAGWDLVVDPGAVDPRIPAWRIEKGVFDMWEEPGLALERVDGSARVDRDRFFADLLAGGVRTVTVVGVAADFCVRWAVEGLVARGFRVDLCAAMTRGIVREIEQVADEEWRDTPVRLL